MHVSGGAVSVEGRKKKWCQDEVSGAQLTGEYFSVITNGPASSFSTRQSCAPGHTLIGAHCKLIREEKCTVIATQPLEKECLRLSAASHFVFTECFVYFSGPNCIFPIKQTDQNDAVGEKRASLSNARVCAFARGLVCVCTGAPQGKPLLWLANYSVMEKDTATEEQRGNAVETSGGQ